MKRIKMPDEVQFVLGGLKKNGFEAFIVGGCVRDKILGTEPLDYDVTTSATPEEIKKIFRKTFDTGIEHGTVTVIQGEMAIEVTTYRVDGKYIDNRHPESVTYTRLLEEDLKRRDFTMNAMAYNDEVGLVDIFSGEQDLREGVIRCVGEPNERFHEDALRMIRAVRFSAKFDFGIEQKTLRAIQKNSRLLENISKERLREEMNKILLSDHPEKIVSLHDLGLLEFIMPEFIPLIGNKQNNPWHIYDIAEHTILSVKNMEKDLTLRLTMLLHDIGKSDRKTTDVVGVDHFYRHAELGSAMAKDILTRLRYDNKTISKVSTLIKYHDFRLITKEKNVRRALAKLTEEVFLDLIKVRRADDSAKNPEKVREESESIQKLIEVYGKIKKQGDCFKKADLKINGRDLIELGIVDGREIGRILDKVFMLVLEDPSLNEKEKLIQTIKRNFIL